MEQPILDKDARLGILIIVLSVVFWIILFVNWWVFTTAMLITSIIGQYWIFHDDIKHHMENKAKLEGNDKLATTETVRYITATTAVINTVFAPAIIFEILRNNF